MNHRTTSILSFGATLAAAVLAAATMTGAARAEGPLEQGAPFTGTFSRAQVQAELMQGRHQAGSYANEWISQRGAPQGASGYTRAQARTDYIASREEVRAMNAEHGGGGYFAYRPARPADTMLAGGLAR